MKYLKYFESIEDNLADVKNVLLDFLSDYSDLDWEVEHNKMDGFLVGSQGAIRVESTTPIPYVKKDILKDKIKDYFEKSEGGAEVRDRLADLGWQFQWVISLPSGPASDDEWYITVYFYQIQKAV